MYNAAADQRVTTGKTACRLMKSDERLRPKPACYRSPATWRPTDAPNITATKPRYSAHGWLWTNALTRRPRVSAHAL